MTKFISMAEIDGPEVRSGPSVAPQAPSLRWHSEAAPDLSNRWHCKGVTPEAGIAMLGGAWGTGKSFTALELCRCTMTGEPFAGQRIKRVGGVLWFAAEASGEVEARLEALRQDERLPSGKAMPFAWTTEVPVLTSEGAEAALLAAVREADAEMRRRFNVPLVMIVVDTLMAAAGFQDENSSAESQKAMKPLAAVARTMGILVLVVDHYGRDATAGLRGSTNKGAFADAILGINSKKQEDGTVTDRVLVKVKVRSGTEGVLSRMDLRIINLGTDEDGDALTSMVVDFVDHADEPRSESRRKPSPMAALFFSCFEVALGDKGRPFRPMPDSPEVRAVNAEDLRLEYYLRRVDAEPDAKQKAFRRSLDRAVERRELGYAQTAAGEFLWQL